MRKAVVQGLGARLSAAQAVAAPSRGIFSFFGKSNGTSLSEPLPGFVAPEPAVPTKPPTTQVTTLPNGAKIASENTPVRPPSARTPPQSRHWSIGARIGAAPGSAAAER